MYVSKPFLRIGVYCVKEDLWIGRTRVNRGWWMYIFCEKGWAPTFSRWLNLREEKFWVGESVCGCAKIYLKWAGLSEDVLWESDDGWQPVGVYFVWLIIDEHFSYVHGGRWRYILSCCGETENFCGWGEFCWRHIFDRW